MKIYRLHKEARFGQEQAEEIVRDIKIKQSVIGDFVVEAATDEGSVDNLIELPPEFAESPQYRISFKNSSKAVIGEPVGVAMKHLEKIVYDITHSSLELGGFRE